MKTKILFFAIALSQFPGRTFAQNSPGGVSSAHLTTWFDANSGTSLMGVANVTGEIDQWTNRQSGRAVTVLNRVAIPGSIGGASGIYLSDDNEGSNFNRSVLFLRDVTGGFFFKQSGLNNSQVFSPSAGSVFGVAGTRSPAFQMKLSDGTHASGFGLSGILWDGAAVNWNPAFQFLGIPQMVGLITSANNPVAYNNASSFQGLVGTGNAPSSGYGYILGSDASGESQHNVNEIITYDSDIDNSAGQGSSNAIFSYLAIKYGITYGNNISAPASNRQDYNLVINTLNNTKLNLWKSTSPADPGYNFHHRIAGIARVDNSALYQKQSHSTEDPDTRVTIGLGAIASANRLNSYTLADNNALVWGDDGQDIYFDSYFSLDVNICVQHSDRNWKIQRTGEDINTKNTQVVFNATGTFPAEPDIEPYLLIDRNADGDYTDSDDEAIPGAYNASDKTMKFDNVVWDTDGSGFDIFTFSKDILRNNVVLASSGVYSTSNFSNCDPKGWMNFRYLDYVNYSMLAIKNNDPVNKPLTVSNVTVAAGREITSSVDKFDVHSEVKFAKRFIQVDASPNTALDYHIRIYYDPGELTVSQSSRAEMMLKKNNWLKYEGGYLNWLSGFTSESTGPVTTLTASENGIEDGVPYIQFNHLTSFSSFGYASIFDNNPLPVRLVRFSATGNEADVFLKWTTADEQNFDRFEIQRSADGKNYQTVETEPSARSGGGDYTFTDKSAGSKGSILYYRLKIVDTDDSFAYSSVKSVNFSGASVLLYPNPTSGKMLLKGLKAGEMIDVYDEKGKRIFSEKATANQQSFDLGKSAAGAYVVEVSGATGTKFKGKLVKAE